MNIDRQRISAVKTLEAMGYTWEGGQLWKPPIGKQASTPLTVERDLDLLRMTICRVFQVSYEQTIPLIAEIKSWGWFK